MAFPLWRGYPVVDMDLHIYEPEIIRTEYLEPQFREEAALKFNWSQSPDSPFARLNRGKSYVMGHDSGPGLRWAEQHPGYHFPGADDGVKRIECMDEEGIDIGIVRNTQMAGVGRLPESDYLLVDALCRAYNNWVHDFCSADPTRLYPEAVLPCVCMPMAIAELERTAKMGFRGAVVRGSTAGAPLSDPSWDPLFNRLQDMGWPLTIHASFDPSVDSAAQWIMPHAQHPESGHAFWGIFGNFNFMLDNIVTMGEITLGGMLDKFPKLNIVFIESGSSWVGETLYRLDKTFDAQWQQLGFSPLKAKTKPSEIFARQIYMQFEGGDMCQTKEGIERMANNLVWASDIPHWDGDSPGEGWSLLDRCKVSKEVERKIMSENGLKLLGVKLDTAKPKDPVLVC